MKHGLIPDYITMVLMVVNTNLIITLGSLATSVQVKLNATTYCPVSELGNALVCLLIYRRTCD